MMNRSVGEGIGRPFERLRPRPIDTGQPEVVHVFGSRRVRLDLPVGLADIQRHPAALRLHGARRAARIEAQRLLRSSNFTEFD